MNGLFRVRRGNDNGDIYTVYGVRTEDGPMGTTQFLIYEGNNWRWDFAGSYIPYERDD
jgi:hypothetical protein